MKSKRELLIILGLAIIVIGFVIAIFINDGNKYLIDISYKELVKKIENKESFILYVGKEGCSACETFNPKFKNVINKYKVTAYYLDLAKYSDEEKEYVVDNVSFKGTPTVVFMEKGKDSLSSDTKIVGANISEDKIIEKLKNRGYIK